MISKQEWKKFFGYCFNGNISEVKNSFYKVEYAA